MKGRLKSMTMMIQQTQDLQTSETTVQQWHQVAEAAAFPPNGGACVKVGNQQIAIFYFERSQEWYATQNQCPHKAEMALARGLIGDQCGEPKVACPFHKKSFSLKTGENLNGEDYHIQTYPVKVEAGFVYVGLSDPIS